MKNVLKTILLLTVSSVLTLGFAELLIRLAVPQRLDSNVRLYASDDELVFKLSPNLDQVHSNFEFVVPVKTNSVGLRDAEIKPKDPTSFRVLGLGDSFSFANGVSADDTYFKKLENRLRGETSAITEILNCAVPAYSLIQELKFAKRFGQTLEANAYLVGFYVGNDFIDSYDLYDENGEPLITIKNGGLRTKKEGDVEPNPIRRATASTRMYLSTRSHLYVFLRNRLSEVLSRLNLRAPIPPPEFCERTYSSHMEKGWALTRQLLVEFAEEARVSKKGLYVVILPTIYQVYQDVWSNYLAQHKLNADDFDLDKPQRILSEFCAEIGIPVIDVLPSLRRRAVDQQLFYPVDSHLNADGHQAVADSLRDYFRGKW